MRSICVNSQSPPLRLLKPQPATTVPQLLNIDELVEGEDYRSNTGGVTRMVAPIIMAGAREGHFSNVDWVTLSGDMDFEVDMNGYVLHGLGLQKPLLRRYATYKEALWEIIHGRTAEPSEAGFKAFVEYNRLAADRIRRLNEEADYDMIYVHDFQQLPQGKLLNSQTPLLFRWHIPMRAEFFDEPLRELLVGFLEEYPTVVVSSERYAEELRMMGFQGNVVHSYPYVDEGALARHEGHELAEFRERWGISQDDKVIICVARRTPSKNQGVLIRAMRSITRRFPGAKLLLVGNGSFSSSKEGGLGISKSEKWARHLDELAKSTGLEDNVIMTGYLPQEEVQMAYQTSDVVALPSILEGFGLVVIEAWLYGKPVVVSRTAGAAEIVSNGESGYTFDPHKPKELAERISTLLAYPSMAERMGQVGLETADAYTLRAGLERELRLMDETVELWESQRTAAGQVDSAEV